MNPPFNSMHGLVKTKFLYLQALSVRPLYNYIIAFVICVHPWGEEQIKALSVLAL